MKICGDSSILVDFTPKCTFGLNWAPKTINIPCATEGFPPRAGKVRFWCEKLQIHEIPWNFAEFSEMRAAGAPENEKVDLELYRCPFRVVIFTSKSVNLHDFYEKAEYSWISWNFVIFTKTALFAPKTINIPGAMEGFPPWAGTVRFLQKVALFALFHTFRENHAFSWFSGFCDFPLENIDLALYRWPFF